MTTIVYSHKEGVIAADSRCTKGMDIISDAHDKFITRDDGVIFAGCGSVADIQLLAEAYPFGLEGIDNLNAEAFVIDHGCVSTCQLIKGDFLVTPLQYDMTLGSGSPFATAALDFGKTAKQAVKYAMTRDAASGGKVKVVKVK